MEKQIKALTFDVFGTVVDWVTSVERECKAATAHLDVDIDWEEFVLRWREEGYIHSLIKIVKGEMDIIPTSEMHMIKLVELLNEYGIQGLVDDEIQSLNRAWHRLDPWSDTVEGLTRLKEDFMIMTFSNGSYRTMLDIAKRGGLPWDGIISAQYFNKVKPDVTIYRDVCRFLDLDCSEVLMVACHAADLDAARKAGMKTAYVTRPLEKGSKSAPEDIPVPFDYHAKDFIELSEILKKDLNK